MALEPRPNHRFADLRERLRLVRTQMKILISRDDKDPESRIPIGTFPARMLADCAKEVEQIIVDLRVLEGDVAFRDGASAVNPRPAFRRNT